MFYEIKDSAAIKAMFFVSTNFNFQVKRFISVDFSYMKVAFYIFNVAILVHNSFQYLWKLYFVLQAL